MPEKTITNVDRLASEERNGFDLQQESKGEYE